MEGLFDGGVVEDFVGDEFEFIGRGGAVNEVFGAGAHGMGGEAEVGDAFDGAEGDGVHDAGFLEDLDDVGFAFAGGGEGAAGGVGLVDGIAEKAGGDAVNVALAKGAGEEEDLGDADVADGVDAKVADVVEDALPDGVGEFFADGDFDAPVVHSFGHEAPRGGDCGLRNADCGMVHLFRM